jgi:hypothetical protein
LNKNAAQSLHESQRETAMLLRYSLVAAVLIAVTSPALATEYYISKDPALGSCDVVTTKPDSTKMFGTTGYASRGDAKAAKKAAKASGQCK